jgi:hypothetical protein
MKANAGIQGSEIAPRVGRISHETHEKHEMVQAGIGAEESFS